jgi:hypothetical protein
MLMYSLIDKKKQAEVLQRIRDRKAPFCAEKPAPEMPVTGQGRIFQPSFPPYAENDLGKEITPIICVTTDTLREGYLKARWYAECEGKRLPSNVLHDDYLVGSGNWKGLIDEKYYGAWAREILAYPEKDGVFEAGKDIVDSETGWTIPSFYVPPQALGVKGAGLFIDPGEIKEIGGRVAISPRTIIVLNGIIQESGSEGRVDPNTHVPLEVDAQLLAQLDDSDKRWFFRISGICVRPLARGSALPNSERDVYAKNPPSAELGVGGVQR